jgi:SAM-dependent methyltransferase
VISGDSAGGGPFASLTPPMDAADSGLILEYLTATHWRTVDLLHARDLDEREPRCVVCDHAAPRSAFRRHVAECQFGGGYLERYACPECDAVFGPLKMLDLTPSQLALEYRVLYSYYSEFDATDSEVRAFHACRPVPGGLYLNWGCGVWAGTIDRLRSDGYDVWGYEPAVPSDSPYVVAREGEITALFDAIFSHNVLEHFADPVHEFRRMRSHLKPGGLMVHASPCYKLVHEDTRFHLAFFLGRSVEVLAARTDFEILEREDDGEYMHAVFRAT